MEGISTAQGATSRQGRRQEPGRTVMTAGWKGNPAEVQARRLEIVAEEMARLFRRPEVAWLLQHAPAVHDWSAMQILGHMVELISYWRSHVKGMIAAAGEPYPIGRAAEAPERLAGIEHGAAGDPEELLRRLEEEVRAAAADIRRMTAEERRRTGVHVKKGRIAVSEVIERLIVAHAEEHLSQVQAALRL